VTYAVNALLTAVVLGSVLALILGGYYARNEDQYLQAAASRAVTALAWQGIASQDLLQQARSVAISTQTRVKYYDASHALLADSGSPRSINPTTAFGRSTAESRTPPPSGPGMVPPPNQMPNPGGSGIFGPPSASGLPSNRTLEIATTGSSAGQVAYVVVGEAPASGKAMLVAVVQGWMLSAIVAVFLAAISGYLLSARISRPIIELTEATDRMAQGDLSVRARVISSDEIGRLSQSFNSMAERIESGMVALRRFVADAAHELRTPLTALQTDLHIARSAAATEEERERITQASRQAKRLEGLADGLLRLSRLEAGEELRYTSVDLAELVSACADTIASRAEQAGLQLDIEVDLNGPFVLTDESKVAVAIENLLDNAVKFTPSGGTVTTGASVDGDEALVWVADTGIGIPPEDRDDVFSRFNRAHNVSAYPGSGLGLAVVRAIIEALGGRVELGEAEAGTRFEIRLPLG
jgi:signal transduction histidine kinase